MVLQPVDTITKPKVDDKSKQLTLGEKKLIAAVTPNASLKTTIPAVPRMTSTGTSDNITSTEGDKVEELKISNDQDIKNMLAEIKGSQTSPAGPGGEVPGEGVGPVIEPLDKSLIKGLLFTVYRLPSFIYRVKGFELPESISLDIEMQAEQLNAIMVKYGITSMKYIDLLIFGSGIAMNMATVIGQCRELKEKQKIEDEHKNNMDKIRNEEMEKQERLRLQNNDTLRRNEELNRELKRQTDKSRSSTTSINNETDINKVDNEIKDGI